MEETSNLHCFFSLPFFTLGQSNDAVSINKVHSRTYFHRHKATSSAAAIRKTTSKDINKDTKPTGVSPCQGHTSKANNVTLVRNRQAGGCDVLYM